jgi:RimJ/RimL family protein N-acetyltransferase
VDGEKKRTKISNKISPIYLAVWMNVYLNSLGATNVRLSSLEYKRIIDVLSSSSTITSSTSTTSTTTTTSTSTSSTTNLKGKTLSDYSVREATLFDLTTLHLFEQELIKYERPFASNLKQDPIHYYNIKDLIERKDAVLLVVEVNTSGEGGRAGRAGRLIGSGYALIKESPPHKQPNQFAYLGFMYVAPDYRGQGLNGVVMQQLIDWSKERGIVEIQLDVFAANQSALRAYEKIGFQPDLLKMRLRR